MLTEHFITAIYFNNIIIIAVGEIKLKQAVGITKSYRVTNRGETLSNINYFNNS
jgi:hypothetical protein